MRISDWSSDVCSSDLSVHIYGALRGRALAGAQGNEKARIFCRAFHAELVAIAGHYKVLEDITKELHGKPVQVWLENAELTIAVLECPFANATPAHATRYITNNNDSRKKSFG